MAPELPNLTTLAPAGAGFVSTVSAPPSVLSVVCAEACSDVVVCAVDDPQPANVSYSQKKDSENFLLYKGKNNAFVVAASIAGLAIGGASTIGIAENAFTVGLSAGWYDTAWAIGAVVSSMLAVCVTVKVLNSYKSLK